MIKLFRRTYIGFLKPRRRIVDKTGKKVERFEPSRKLLSVMILSILGFSFIGI